MTQKIDGTKLEEALSTVSRIITGFLPGGHVLTELMQFNSSLKLTRAIEFIEKFQVELEEALGRKIEIGDYKNEDFISALDAVIAKIVVTKSENKKTRYRKLLLNQTINPSSDYIFDKFVALLSEIDDIQILILEKIRGRRSLNKLQSLEKLDTLFDPIPDSKYDFENFGKKLPETIDIRVGTEIKTLQRSHFQFLGLDLLSKGLIVQDAYKDSRAFELSGHHSYIGGDDDVHTLKEQLKELSENLQKQFKEEYRLSDMAKIFLEFIKTD